VRDGRVAIEPAELSKRYFAWVDNMHDWCISRQLWWGHRIPVWYGPEGQVVCVGPDEQPPAGEGWHQDEDVLDTWFSSGLWPFSTLGWPEETVDLAKFYPTSVLVTGYDILFFWVARMMMFGLYVMDGKPPFDVVALHGMVRDQNGKKMSKSFGNVVDPLDWIDRFGADATRFTLARGANPGSDVPVSEEWCQGSRNFCNKLWNATRFAMMNGATVAGPLPAPDELGAIDKWVLSRLQHVTAEVDEQFEKYEFAKVCDALYHFAWDDICDWYVELSKPVLAGGGPQADRTRRVLGHVLDQLLRLLHPVIPFVTEELWIALTGGETVMRAAWPVADQAWIDDAAEDELAALQKVVTEVRRFRSDQGVKPSQRVQAALTGLGNVGIDTHEPLIRSLARLDAPAADFTATATLAVTGGITVDLDTRGTIDVAAERARLHKDRAAAEKEAAQCRAKLDNAAFVGKAPEQVVAKIKDRLAAAEADLTRIVSALELLPSA
jgi:valyl-tRNA synthetase